jgi:hypothetical protein
MSGYELFECSWKIALKDPYLTTQHFTWSWQNTFTIRVSNVITVQFLSFIESQFTTNAQKYPVLESIHAWTLLMTECRTLSKVPGRYTNGLTGIKLCLLSVSYCSLNHNSKHASTITSVWINAHMATSDHGHSHQNYNFACRCVWVWNLVSHIEGGI